MQAGSIRVLLIFLFFIKEVLSVVKANSDGATAKKGTNFLMRTNDDEEAVKDGAGGGKSRAPVDDDEKDWIVEFCGQIVTAADIRSMNEAQVQALVRKDNRMIEVILRFFPFDE